MLEILAESTDTCIGFKATGKLTSADYETLLPRLDKAIEAHGKISMVVVLEDFRGWGDLDAVKDDFQFGTTEYRSVERCAFVSDKKWHKRAINIMDVFTRRTDEEFYTYEQLQEAWDWACTKD